MPLYSTVRNLVCPNGSKTSGQIKKNTYKKMIGIHTPRKLIRLKPR